MAANVKVCEVEPELKKKLSAFRFRKAQNNAAIIMKLDKEKRLIVLDEEYEDCTVEQVKDELPESQPRFVVYSYVQTHADGRTSYPLCFIFVSPQGCNPEQQMMYTGSLKTLISEVGLTKVFEVRSTDELTEEWLLEKLQFFR